MRLPIVATSATEHKKVPTPSGIDNIRFGPAWRSAQPSYTLENTDSWITYGQEYIKFGVARDGIYRVRYDDLVSYGISPAAINPKQLKVYLKGKEIPIYVSGESDNSFDPGDYIEFLGRRNYGDIRYRQVAPTDSSYYEYLNRYSDTTIYWLNWSGTNGTRVDTIAASTKTIADTLRYYDRLLRSERDIYWDFSLSGGDLRKNYPELLENETWNDGTLGVGKSSVTFSVTNLYPNKPARAFVKLQDFSSNLTTNAHNLSITLNSAGPAYDSGFINKYQGKVLKAEFLSSRLKSGNNTVDLNSYTVPGNSINNIIRDWFELEYPSNLITSSDSLSFAYNNLSAGVNALVIVRGLSSNPVSLYKFTLKDSSIVKITNYTRSNDTLRFSDSVANGNYYFLLRESKIPAPIFFYKKQFVNLRSSTNKADYIAITHPYFQNEAANYLSFIGTTYGVTTKLVSIFDICDEYNYGFWAPEPIKEFLKSTHVYWQSPKPKYVLLLGKGTYDYYGNKFKYAGVPRVPNFVPPYGNPVSDIWFVQWDSTGSLIPQMNIGRIPAKNIDEFQSYVAKHQKYVSKGFDEWNKRFLFFSGGSISDTNQINQAKGVNQFIIDNYVVPPPIGGNVANFFKTSPPNVTNFGPYPPEYITEQIEKGGVFISYIGHSGTQTWDNSITDISQIANIRDRNPMISDFGCSTAKFAEPDILSFSELAVNNINGQAIAYIGNSSLGFTSTAYTFPKTFYKKLLIDTTASLGDIHRLAKIAYLKQYGTSGSYGLFAKTNTLIGDPIVQLPIPEKPNFTVSNSVVQISPERPTDQTDTLIVTVPYHNLGRVPNSSLMIIASAAYGGSDIYLDTVNVNAPYFVDSVRMKIPVKGRPGQHTIMIKIDPSDSIDEIDEGDNILTYSYVVASTEIRNLTITPVNNQSAGTVTFLNPAIPSVQSYFTAEVSTDPGFSQVQSYQVPYDTFFTTYTFTPSTRGKRVWLRTKYNGINSEGLTYSYVVGEKDNISFSDSVSLSDLTLQDLKILNGSIALDTTKVIFKSISGGFNDGNTAVITKNGQNFIPENTVRGFHVCIFDASTYEFRWYYRFDVQANATVATNFKTLLDTLAATYIVIIAISNDVSSNGSLFPASLKTSIKQYGSKYIDSVKVADSWTMIGKKGASVGSVPEKFQKRYGGGSISIDTTISIPNLAGTIQTGEYGDVSKWKDVRLGYISQIPGDITVSVHGVKNDMSMDTLIANAAADTSISLSGIDAQIYPRIFLSSILTRGSGNPSPSISSIEINYDALPELGTNYQAVRMQRRTNGNGIIEMIPSDTVLQGEKVKATFRVYNAGGVVVRNVVARINAVWENNTNELVGSFVIDTLKPKSYKELSATYSTELGFGKRNIQFTIDPDTSVRELYRDNNVFVFPIVIKKNENSPLLPNLAIGQTGIVPQASSFTDQLDTLRFLIHYDNTGTLINDSVTINVKHFYKNSIASQWTVRRKYPGVSDTFFVSVPIVRRAGEHQLQVELDPVGLIVESSESDNSAAYYFTITTTAFTIIQPSQFSTSAVSHIIFLNPTSAAAFGQRTALLEIDSLPAFSTAQSVQLAMQEFTTSYNIGALNKKKRYYWRIKEQNLSSDWTSGTFYLGDSTAFALGQIDSTAWMMNSFTRTLFSSDSGARIVDTKFRIEAYSAGFNDGNNGSITVNGTNIISSIFGNGFNIIVLDTVSYQSVMKRRFNVSSDPNESDSLVQFITSIPTGLRVIAVVVDDGGNNLTAAARNALKTIGSAYIDQLSFRDSWSIIGTKGASIGSVPELYKPQGTGSATVETTFVREENTGTILTPAFSSFAQLSNLAVNGIIPPGSQLVTKVLGITPSGGVDTVLSASNQLSIPLNSFNATAHSSARIMFDLSAFSSQTSPRVYGWNITGLQAVELAVSANSTSISADSVLEGENIQYATRIYNLSAVPAESIVVRLTSAQSGIKTVLKEEIIPLIPPQDSVTFTYTYDSRSRRGSRTFVLVVDPDETEIEVDENNNSVTTPFFVRSDSIKPRLQISFDGLQIVNGDYVSQRPEIRIVYTDDNPAALLQTDTTNFSIFLNGNKEAFAPGSAELMNTSTSGRAEIRWTPVLDDGDNYIEVYVRDIAGNFSDTLNVFVKVASQFRLLDVFTIPNPFNRSTHFTFNLAGPVIPEEVIIKVYTVAGRLIHEMHQPAIIGFNKIFWDGRDKDGDEIGNGLYLYRVIVNHQGKQTTATQKLVKMR
ncbi:MAG: C25 family cysteine peptidase [Bacteroidota bacterium]